MNFYVKPEYSLIILTLNFALASGVEQPHICRWQYDKTDDFLWLRDQLATLYGGYIAEINCLRKFK
jgi:hypothetical protein